MTLWNDFNSDEQSAIANAMVAACTSASGVTLSSAQSTTFASLITGHISLLGLGGVHCLWDKDEGGGVVGAAASIMYSGTPYIPDIVAILRNTTDNNFVPDYGRHTSTASTNKSGTEQVALSGNPGTTVEEKITIGAPDIRAASVGNVTAEDVDAGEKFRFDAESEKSLHILIGKWIKRASFPADL